MVKRTGTGGADNLLGSKRKDVLDGAGGDDVLNGRGGNDRLLGGSGSDIFHGGDGNDTILPGTNQDIDLIFGGKGSDTIDFAGSAPATGFAFHLVEYAFFAGTVNAAIGKTSGVINKSDGSTDRLINLQDSSTWGLGITGSEGNDRFKVNAAEGVFVQISPLAGNDLIIGGASFDRIVYSDSAPPLVVNVGRSNDKGMFGKIIDGHGGVDRFRKIDEIRGGDGADRFKGSAGDDQFITDGGDDIVDGKGGFDRLNYDRDGLAEIRADLARGEIAELWVSGSSAGLGRFVDSVKNVESIRGSDGDDVIKGARANERLDGRDGDDMITGRGGDDTLLGGAGADGFEFRKGYGDDRINDWEDGVDLVRLKRTAADSSFSDLTVSENSDGDAVVGYANVTITFVDVAASAIGAADFEFF